MVVVCNLILEIFRSLEHNLPNVTISKKILPMIKILESLRDNIEYEWIGFTPWLVNPNPNGISANSNNFEEFNMFTGLAHTYHQV